MHLALLHGHPRGQTHVAVNLISGFLVLIGIDHNGDGTYLVQACFREQEFSRELSQVTPAFMRCRGLLIFRRVSFQHLSAAVEQSHQRGNHLRPSKKCGKQHIIYLYGQVAADQAVQNVKLPVRYQRLDCSRKTMNTFSARKIRNKLGFFNLCFIPSFRAIDI